MTSSVIHAGYNTATVFARQDISTIEQQVFDGKLLRTMPAAFYGQFPRDMVSQFLLTHGLYVLPTLELISFLRSTRIESNNTGIFSIIDLQNPTKMECRCGYCNSHKKRRQRSRL